MQKVNSDPHALGLPYDTWRVNQREVTEEILNSYAGVVLLRARTGFGKQAVAAALANIVPRGALAVVHTIQLQEQYASTIGGAGATLVKGRPNFTCPLEGINAGLTECKSQDCKPAECEYAEQKWQGEHARFTVTNYAYAARIFRSDSGFAGRSWMVCDEGQHILGALHDVLHDEEEERVFMLRKKMMQRGMIAEARKLQPDPMPTWPSHSFFPRLGKYAERLLVMSATLPPPKIWAEVHHMPVNDIHFIEPPDTWGNNSPVRLVPVVALNHTSSSYDYDRMAAAIERIINSHPDQKGIIHPHSYDMVRRLYDRIDNPRILWALRGLRKENMRAFVESDKPLVLCSPAVHEGFDLPYQIGFQLIVKTPFPNLGDPYIKRRAREYRQWYTHETVSALCQAVGRAVRAPDDYGVTYVLDKTAERLFEKESSLFPKWILNQTEVSNG